MSLLCHLQWLPCRVTDDVVLPPAPECVFPTTFCCHTTGHFGVPCLSPPLICPRDCPGSSGCNADLLRTGCPVPEGLCINVFSTERISLTNLSSSLLILPLLISCLFCSQHALSEIVLFIYYCKCLLSVSFHPQQNLTSSRAGTTLVL